MYLAHEEALSGNICRYVALRGNLGQQAVDRAQTIQNKPRIRFSRQTILVVTFSPLLYEMKIIYLLNCKYVSFYQPDQEIYKICYIL